MKQRSCSKSALHIELQLAAFASMLSERFQTAVLRFDQMLSVFRLSTQALMPRPGCEILCRILLAEETGSPLATLRPRLQAHDDCMSAGSCLRTGRLRRLQNRLGSEPVQAQDTRS